MVLQAGLLLFAISEGLPLKVGALRTDTHVCVYTYIHGIHTHAMNPYMAFDPRP